MAESGAAGVKLWLAKVHRGKKVGLIPTDEITQKIIAGMSDGECALVEFVRPRSVPWNSMYHAMCREIGVNQDPQRTEGSIDAELRIRGGHFETIFVDGHEIRMPKRIAFTELSADEWAEIWPSIELAVRETFGEEFIRELAA